MVMIGEESNVKDRPIYLQVGNLYDLSNSFWFVIEEKAVDLVTGTTIEEEEEEINHKNEEIREIPDGEIMDYDSDEKEIHKDDDRDEEISVVMQIGTDEFRQLPFDCPDSFHSKLVVFNSRFYVFGGYAFHSNANPYGKKRLSGHDTKVIYLDTNQLPEKVWSDGPNLKVRKSTLSVVALEKLGLFVAVGTPDRVGEPFLELLHDSLNGNWEMAPLMPGPERFEIKDASVLAVTDTKVYIHGVGDRYRMGLTFDVESSEWNIFDRSFDGTWLPGLVLEFFGTSYLFLFGIHSLNYRLKSTPFIRTQQLCVYDLNKSTWLPLPVQGLPEDGMVLPDLKYMGGGATSYLLQMNQRNKLAFIWSIPFHTRSEFLTKINCTKFILHCTTGRDSQHPTYHAEVVSFGSYHLKAGGPLWNCVPSLIGKDKGLLEDKKTNLE